MITIQRQPDDLQPSMTDGLFYTLSSDKTDQYKYRYVFWVYVNGTRVFQGKSTPNPVGLGVVDVSEILKTYTNSSVEISDAISSQYIHQTERFSTFDEREVNDYYVLFGEEYATGLTSSVVSYRGIDDVAGNPALQSETRKVFNGTYPTNIYGNRQNFTYTPYIMDDTPVQYQQGLFLTNSPRIMDVSLTDRHTLSFFNYKLGSDITSYAYQVEYTFFDSDGVELSSATLDNITSNGGGPLTGLTGLGYDDPFEVSSGYTWNVVNVGSGPYNIEQSIGIPTNTKFYKVRMKGLNQSSSFGCPTGYEPAYIESCAFGYRLLVCASTGATSERFYWPSGLSQWNADCFFVAAFGGPGGEVFTGGTSYGSDCLTCYDVEFGGIPEGPPNEEPTDNTPITGMTATSETFQFNIEEDCDYWNNKQLVWKNRYGTFDYYKFSKRNGEGLNIDRQTYTQIPVSWGSSNPEKTRISRGLTDFNVSIQETHIVNTGFVNQATMVWLEECYTSPEVYLIESDGTLFPINITSTDYIRKNKGNKELINLELTYTYSNNIRLI